MLPITLDDSEVRSTALRALCRDWVLEWLGWLDPPPLCSSVGLVILSYTKKTCRWSFPLTDCKQIFILSFKWSAIEIIFTACLHIYIQKSQQGGSNLIIIEKTTPKTHNCTLLWFSDSVEYIQHKTSIHYPLGPSSPHCSYYCIGCSYYCEHCSCYCSYYCIYLLYYVSKSYMSFLFRLYKGFL